MNFREAPPLVSPTPSAHPAPQHPGQAGKPNSRSGGGFPIPEKGIPGVLNSTTFSRFTRPLALCLSARRYYRIAGRFYHLRVAYGALRGGIDRLRGLAIEGKRQRVVQLDHESTHDSAHVSTAAYVGALERNGVCTGFRLPPATVQEISRYATVQPCTRPGHGERFLITTVRNGRTADGQRIAVADVIAPGACPVVATLLRDSLLLEVATRYLGFRPTHVEPRLYWSPASEMDDDDRRALGQTIDYHYDIDGFHALYVFFYLTAVDRSTGAHVLIRGSHRRKPLSMILSPSHQPMARIRKWYGQDEEVILEGGPGFGFFEDPACFHRAIPPKTDDRLILQIRYF